MIQIQQRTHPYYFGYLHSAIFDFKKIYTLVDTEPEPVPEPLAVGGTALALAGLTWLKHKKKMAV
ncbi:PEP-CTERM sorting domain-containing protein [Microcoleus sp. B9-D4]|uniref:PEP-CTERM sorting domain-containing protein n=1 Tax=Microcoleus sp. B9-D4 TaxID=2818711 RepID=UPI004040BE77